MKSSNAADRAATKGPNWQVIAGILLLAAMLAGSMFAVKNWRRKGAMTPIEAQALDMSHMPPTVGPIAVTLATVEQGPVTSTLRVTGTAVGFNEQEVAARTQGWLTWMPFYPGDRIRRGQLLARLDTREIDSRVAQEQAAREIAEHTADMSDSAHQQAVAAFNRARSQVLAKTGSVQEASQQEARAKASLKLLQQEQIQSRGEVSEAREALSAAGEERTGAAAARAGAESMLADARAQLAAAKADEEYAAAQLKRSQRLVEAGVASAAALQRDRAAAQAATSRVSQAEARINGVQEQIRAAGAAQRKADAMERAAQAKLAQAISRLEGFGARLEQAQADIASAEARSHQARSELQSAQSDVESAEAGVQGADHQAQHSRAGIRAAQANLTTSKVMKGYTEVRSRVDGVVTRRQLSPGTLVAAGQTILEVAQIAPIRIQANVPSSDLDRIRKGSRLRVRGGAGAEDPGARGEGRETKDEWVEARVSSVFPGVDPQARSGIVEALTPNTGGRFHPGQFVTVEITTGDRPAALHVPVAALVWRAGFSSTGQSGAQKATVWVAEEKAAAGPTIYYCPMHLEVRTRKPGLCPKCKMDLVPEATSGGWRVRRMPVEVGMSDGRVSEIHSGLTKGQRVVVTGLNDLREGDAVVPVAAAE